MRIAEIVLGVFVMAAAVAQSLGLAVGLVPVPPMGLGPVVALVAFGGALAAHGMLGRVRKRSGDTAFSRHFSLQFWRVAFTLLVAVAIVAMLPLAADPLSLASVAGFPLGFYAVAQGVLVALAILAFRAAQHLDAIDRETASASPGEEP
jgi:putative solute:sodium symporter small subunit